ncbi:LysE family translocator, partial [Thioclava sp. BHET1]
VLGISLGLAVQVVAAATGLSALAAGSAALYHALRWAGVGYMAYLAWCAWAESAAVSGAEEVAQPAARRAFRRGLISNLLNPKALVFYMLVVGQFTRADAGPLWGQILILGGLHVAIAFAVHGAIVLLGARIGGHLGRWRHAVPVRAGFALALLAVAVWVAVTTAGR